jgi:transcriptional regulator with XRE-family HTH domain
MDNQVWDNLRAIRKQQNKSLEKVALDLGMDASSLSRIETKNSPNVSFEKIYELSRYYNVSLEKLVSENINEENLIDEESDEIIISESELPYYRVIREAKKEGLSPEETKTIINLFKKISAAAQSADIKDQYYKLAYKAKSNGVPEDKFKNMVEYMIKNEELVN